MHTPSHSPAAHRIEPAHTPFASERPDAPHPSSHRRSNPSTRPTRSRLRSVLLGELDREWERLSRRHRADLGLDTWRSGEPGLDQTAADLTAGVDGVGDLLELTGQRHGPDADTILRWLLLTGQRGEPVAARIVLQRIIPLLAQRAARWRRHDGSRGTTGTALEELLAAAAIEIAHHRPLAGVEHIAPRLVGAAEHHAFRKQRRRADFDCEVATSPDRFNRASPEPELDRTVAVVRLLAAGRSAGVDPGLLDLARRLARGESPTTIARLQSCTTRTIRNHRSRLVACLRSTVDAAATDDDWSDPLTLIEHAVA